MGSALDPANGRLDGAADNLSGSGAAAEIVEALAAAPTMLAHDAGEFS
jgi:hypothetical protein